MMISFGLDFATNSVLKIHHCKKECQDAVQEEESGSPEDPTYG
jgi:hypothetical protein